jgi:hypothetical protein
MQPGAVIVILQRFGKPSAGMKFVQRNASAKIILHQGISKIIWWNYRI